ncbi:unnamed protein product [Meloidogyne enterolobii]|uniref:Uncharacterized protein n=1 Tax=Meloidogyne enterolobii TaxID=390850 RepID=A0ACB0ZV14_MELEN
MKLKFKQLNLVPKLEVVTMIIALLLIITGNKTLKNWNLGKITPVIIVVQLHVVFSGVNVE